MDPNKFKTPPVFASLDAGHRLRFPDLFRLSLRIFITRPTRTFLTIFGISIGIGGVLFLVSLGYGLQYILIGKLAATEDSLLTVEAYYPSESGFILKNKDIEEISLLGQSREISPVAETPGEATVKGFSGFLLVRQIRSNYFRLSGIEPSSGSGFSEGERAVVISKSALKLFNIKDEKDVIGAPITFRIFNNMAENAAASSNVSPLMVKGVIGDEFEPPYVLVPVQFVEPAPASFQRIFVKSSDIDEIESLRDKLIAKGLLISARIDLVKQAKKIMNAITAVLGVFGVTALVVSAIGMFNTMIISFLERIFEVGVMKSIGASSKDVRNLFLMESFLMGIAGGFGGIAVGVGVGQLFNFGLNMLARHLGGKPLNLFIYPVQFILFILLLSALVGGFAGFWPARRAAKLSALEAFKRK